jgi:hypothetical protein
MPDPKASAREDQNAADIASTNPEASIMLVGDKGTKKTTFLSEIPGIFVYDFDRGMAIARGKQVPYRTFKDAPYGSRAISVKHGIYEWGTAYPAFLDDLNVKGQLIDKGAFPHLAMGFDSLSTLATLMKNYVQKSKGKTPRDSVTMPEWGDIMNLMETLLEQVTGWPVLTVVTGHIHRVNNEEMGRVEYMPLMPGKKLAPRLPVYFDEYYFTLVKGDKFVLRTKGGGEYASAGTRYGVPNETETSWANVAPYIVGQDWKERMSK